MQCGKEFGVIRHVFRRGEFCSKECLEGHKRDDFWRRDWESKARVDDIDDRVDALTITGKAANKALTAVVRWQEGDHKIPLYFIGGELPEFRLAQLMGQGRTIYGIRLRWPLAWCKAATNNNSSALPRVEQMAALYAKALSVHTQLAPCVLVGYSFEGIVAVETARQFQAMGGKVEMVILLDARVRYPPLRPHVVAGEQLRQHWGSEAEAQIALGSRLWSSWSIIWWMLKREIRLIGRRVQQTVLRDPGMLSDKTDERGVPLRWGLIERLFLNAIKSYRPQRLDCRGVLFRVNSEDDGPVCGLDESLGWENLFSDGLEIVEIPGDHVTLMRPGPSQLTLARKMKDLLARFGTTLT